MIALRTLVATPNALNAARAYVILVFVILVMVMVAVAKKILSSACAIAKTHAFVSM
jgi:hypothetical protein